MKKNSTTIIYLFSVLFLVLVGIGLFYALRKNNALLETQGHHAHHDEHSHCCSFKHAALKKEDPSCAQVVCDEDADEHQHADHDQESEAIAIEPVFEQSEGVIVSMDHKPHRDHHHDHGHDVCCDHELRHDHNLHHEHHSDDHIAFVPSDSKILNDELILIDCVLAKVGEEVITQSDVIRPGIDGERHSLAELVEHAAIYEKAKKLGISLSVEMIEKDLKKAAEENNMTYAELLDSLKSAGLTQSELFKKFEALKVVQQLIGYKVGSNSAIAEEEVVSYYHENPVKTTPRYYLKTATVPYNVTIEKEAKTKLKNELIALIKHDTHPSKIGWGNPYWYEHAEIDPTQGFIFDLAVGETSLPYDNGSCFLVYHLEDKLHAQVVPLEERKQEITDLLFRKKWSLLMSELIADVNKDISISYV